MALQLRTHSCDIRPVLLGDGVPREYISGIPRADPVLQSHTVALPRPESREPREPRHASSAHRSLGRSWLPRNTAWPARIDSIHTHRLTPAGPANLMFLGPAKRAAPYFTTRLHCGPVLVRSKRSAESRGAVLFPDYVVPFHMHTVSE